MRFACPAEALKRLELEKVLARTVVDHTPGDLKRQAMKSVCLGGWVGGPVGGRVGEWVEMPKMGPRWAQDGPKMTPRWPQGGPGWPQDALR